MHKEWASGAPVEAAAARDQFPPAAAEVCKTKKSSPSNGDGSVRSNTVPGLVKNNYQQGEQLSI